MVLASVLITDPLDPICGELLENAGVKVTTKTKLTKDELLQEIKVQLSWFYRSFISLNLIFAIELV